MSSSYSSISEIFGLGNGYHRRKRPWYDMVSEADEEFDELRRAKSRSGNELVVIVDDEDERDQSHGSGRRSAKETIVVDDDKEKRDHSGKAEAQSARGTIVLDDDDEHPSGKGAGTQDEPIYFPEWITGSLISKTDHGRYFEIEDDEHVDNYFTTSEGEPSRSPSPVTTANKNLPLNRFNTPANEASDGNDNGECWNSLWQRAAARYAARRTSQLKTAINKPMESGELDDKHDVDNDHNTRHDGAADIGPFADRAHTRLSTPSEDSEDDFPTLTFSQSSQLTESPSTPTSSQSQIENAGSEDPESREIPFHCVPDEPICAGSDTSNDDLRENARNEKERIKRLKEEALKEKKRAFYMEWAPANLKTLETRLQKYRPLYTNPGSCWLYPGSVGVDHRTLDCKLTFKINDRGSRYNYTVNMGFIAILLQGQLCQNSIDGIINHAWHASHLCGNWTCTNPEHLVAEPGRTNLDRNNCLHGRRSVCNHQPRCMTGLKIKELKNIVRLRKRRVGLTLPDKTLLHPDNFNDDIDLALTIPNNMDV